MAEEALATAKVEGVHLWFNDKSTQRQRAVQVLTAGLDQSMFVRVIVLRRVPVEMIKSVRQTLSTNNGVTCVDVTI